MTRTALYSTPLAITLLASSLFVATPALAQSLEVGDVCRLRTAIKASDKANGRGASTLLRNGTEYTVLELGSDRVKVKFGHRKGYLKTAAATKFCRLLTRGGAVVQPEPIPAEDVPAPEPTEGATTGRISELDSSASKPDPVVDRPPASVASAPTETETESASSIRRDNRVKIAVMDLSGAAPEPLRKSLTAVIPKSLDLLGAFRAISTDEVVKLLNYKASQQQLGGCDSQKCMSELSEVLGAEYIITGSVNQPGDLFVLQMQLTRTEDGDVAARLQRHFADKEKLYDGVDKGAKILVRKLLDERSGYLSLDVSEEGATIVVDDQVVGVSPIGPITVAGGVHTIGIEKDGFVIYKTDLEIKQGKVSAHAARLIPSADFIEEYKGWADMLRAMSWVSIGVGAGAIVGAGALYGIAEGQVQEINRDVAAYNRDPNRPTTLFDDLGERQAQVATLDILALTSLTVGIGTIVAGLMLRWYGPDPDRYDALITVDAGAVDAAFDLGPGGMSLRLTF